MNGDEIELVGDHGHFWVTEDNRGECRSCGEPIIWCITAKGKRMPVDIPLDDETCTSSHFATCAHANEWRKS